MDVGNCCYVAVGGARHFGAHGEERGGAYRGGRPPTDCIIQRLWSYDRMAL